MTTSAAEFKQVNDSLFIWSVFDPTVKCELYSTVLKINNGLVVIDPIPLADAAWKDLLANAALRAVLLTNGNHAREADVLRKKFGVPIVTAPATRHDLAPLRPDVILLENELLYGISAIAIPGATPGETAFFNNAGIMVIGDAITNLNVEKGLELLSDKYCSNARENGESLRKLLKYDFHTLAFAHGLPVTDHAKEKLVKLLQS